MRRVVAAAVVVLVIAGGAVALVVAGQDRDPAPATTDPPDRERPGSGVTLVAGSATAVSLNPTLFEPVGLPATFEPFEGGAAAAEISPVVIDGRFDQSIAWTGGTPLVIETVDAREGDGRLSLGPTLVEATADGFAVSLDGVAATLSPGAYRLEGSVAVGAGLGRASDQVGFEATEETVVTVSGAVALRLPPRSITLEGPGEAVMVGDFEVTTAGADRRVAGFRSGPGPYRFDLVWVGDRIEVEGRVEGEVTEIAP